MTTLIRDLIEIPDRVHKGDFVLKLTEGLQNPGQTLRDYVVTPQLAACFQRALGLVKAGLDTKSSKAAFLHGSFGSGKSHFMAVLHMLLNNDPDARSVPELAPVVKDLGWAEKKKFLLVPYHMIGAHSMESSVLGGYVDHVARRHPDAPIPPVFLSEALFENAKQHRAQLGDTPFFNVLNAGKAAQPGQPSDWGDLAGTWDSESFDAALNAPAGADDRLRLVSDLVRTMFPAYKDMAATGGEHYVSLDEGLVILCQHAKNLKYDGLVLFLDELILWLASRIADRDFVAREAQKISKLVEAGQGGRVLPVISFVARQRDLKDLVGEHVPGADKLSLSDVLAWWQGRFDTITLEDRNLPQIASRRILRPKPGAESQIDQAFQKATKVPGQVMDTLLGNGGDPAVFRSVYPFSPALVDSLVAISAALQRERTALKVMLHLLVAQRETLRLGDLIPAGALWDVISEGDEPFTEEMLHLFRQAKKLYDLKLLPALEDEHQVRKDQLTPADAARPEVKGFRRDDGLVKTLLLAALVPEVPALSKLTPARLAALNHGTIQSPIPGREAQIVMTSMRKLGTRMGELRFTQGGADPLISIKLVGIDTDAILQGASHFDSPGNRQILVRKMLFEKMGLEEVPGALFHEWVIPWRGTYRCVDVVFGNVRDTKALPDESLKAVGERWKLVIDFPFDEGGTPADDLARIANFRDANPSTRTLACLPHFLSSRGKSELGTLVVLEEILKQDRLVNHVKHLAPAERSEAKTLLENRRQQLRHRMMETLEMAYGIRPGAGDRLDTTQGSLDHVQSLDHTFSPRPPAGVDFGEAMRNLLDQGLSHQYPAHPKFPRQVKTGELKKVFQVVERAQNEGDGRLELVEKPLQPLMREIAQPLRLGTMHNGPFLLGDWWKNLFDRKIAALDSPPTVGDLHGWMDDPKPMGLQADVADLVVMTFAIQENYTIRLHGHAVTPDIGKLSPDAVLAQQALPDAQEWTTALDRASKLFGLAASPLCNASNVAGLSEQVLQKAAALEGSGQELPDQLARAMEKAGVEDVDSTERMKTARAGADLLRSLKSCDEDGVISVLASARLETGPEALGTSLAKAHSCVDALKGTKWDLISAVQALTDARAAEGQSILEGLRDALRRDELAVGLSHRLKQAESQAVSLLARTPAGGPVVVPPPGPSPVPGPGVRVVDQGREEGLKGGAARALLDRLRGELERDDALALSMTWVISREEGGR